MKSLKSERCFLGSRLGMSLTWELENWLKMRTVIFLEQQVMTSFLNSKKKECLGGISANSKCKGHIYLLWLEYNISEYVYQCQESECFLFLMDFNPGTHSTEWMHFLRMASKNCIILIFNQLNYLYLLTPKSPQLWCEKVDTNFKVKMFNSKTNQFLLLKSFLKKPSNDK